jgi:dienelactone hydrolase
MSQNQPVNANNVIIEFFLNKGQFITLCLIIVTILLGGCSSTWEHKFEGTSGIGKKIELRANIFKPEGEGPFPAVVLLHACGGIVSCDYTWANKLVEWGYVAFVIDSLGPRYKSSCCSSLTASPTFLERALDAHSAKSYLRSLPFIAHDKIAVMGWSHGGNTVATAVSQSINFVFSNQELDPFKAGIAFYPYCVGPVDFNAPLLVLIGEKDNWTPAEWCSDVVEEELKEKPKHELKLKIYKNAHHRFDCNKFINVRKGKYIMDYNSEAAADSIVQVKQFLDKYLK